MQQMDLSACAHRHTKHSHTQLIHMHKQQPMERQHRHAYLQRAMRVHCVCVQCAFIAFDFYTHTHTYIIVNNSLNLTKSEEKDYRSLQFAHHTLYDKCIMLTLPRTMRCSVENECEKECVCACDRHPFIFTVECDAVSDVSESDKLKIFFYEMRKTSGIALNRYTTQI